MLPTLLTQVAASLKLAILYDESASVVSLWCQDIMLVSVLIRILASAQREDESSQGPLSFFWKRKPLIFFGRLGIIVVKHNVWRTRLIIYVTRALWIDLASESTIFYIGITQGKLP